MFLELDLRKIKLLSEENEEKNWRFRSFLKFRGDSRIDRIVHSVYHENTKGEKEGEKGDGRLSQNCKISTLGYNI